MTLSKEVHICSAGETFDAIALGEYGDEKYAAELLQANPALCRVTVFEGGERLQLPVIEMTEDEINGVVSRTETYMPAKAPWKQ